MSKVKEVEIRDTDTYRMEFLDGETNSYSRVTFVYENTHNQSVEITPLGISSPKSAGEEYVDADEIEVEIHEDGTFTIESDNDLTEDEYDTLTEAWDGFVFEVQATQAPTDGVFRLHRIFRNIR